MGVAEDFAPSFTQKPQLRQEDDGNKLIFECQLLGSPKPDIQWFRSDTLLSQDSRTTFKIQSIGTNKYLVVLELDDVIETDAGLYKVKAKNKMGEVAASINLNFSRKCIIYFYRPNSLIVLVIIFSNGRTERKVSRHKLYTQFILVDCNVAKFWHDNFSISGHICNRLIL